MGGKLTPAVARRLVLDWAVYEPVGYVVATRGPGEGTVDLELDDWVMLAGRDGGPDVPGAVAAVDGEVAHVVVLASPDVDVLTELGGENETGPLWAFVDGAPDSDQILPGSFVRAAAGPGGRVWVEVVDRVASGSGDLVHLRRLPVVVTDDSLPLRPQRVRGMDLRRAERAPQEPPRGGRPRRRARHGRPTRDGDASAHRLGRR